MGIDYRIDLHIETDLHIYVNLLLIKMQRKFKKKDSVYNW